MFKRRFILVAGSAVVGTSLLGWQSRPTGQTLNLPPGAMEGKAHTACTSCHDARIILQQRLSKAAWTKEVDKMIKWGTVVDPGDRDGLIDYLSVNFPAERPAEPLLRVGRAKRVARGEKR
jgi:hypothetical protein